MRHELHRQGGASQQPQRGRDVPAADELRGRADLEARELQPQLRGLVHRLEEQLVPVRLLVGRLLEREQLVRAEIALVVALGVPRQDRLRVVLDGHARSILAS